MTLAPANVVSWQLLRVTGFAVTYPDRLIGPQHKRLITLIKPLPPNKIMPLISEHQIDITQVQGTINATDIKDAKNTLSPIHTLAPEAKKALTHLQRKLCSVGVKCRLPTANPNELA